jgi:hypothetical protein
MFISENSAAQASRLRCERASANKRENISTAFAGGAGGTPALL